MIDLLDFLFKFLPSICAVRYHILLHPIRDPLETASYSPKSELLGHSVGVSDNTNLVTDYCYCSLVSVFFSLFDILCRFLLVIFTRVVDLIIGMVHKYGIMMVLQSAPIILSILFLSCINVSIIFASQHYQHEDFRMELFVSNIYNGPKNFFHFTFVIFFTLLFFIETSTHTAPNKVTTGSQSYGAT